MNSKKLNRGLLFAGLLGGLAGLGGFTFHYAAGLSYLSDRPEACVNCHIMNEQFDSWRKGPHHAVASCNDCQIPQEFFGRYLAKTRNGYHHSKGFTLQPYAPDEPGADVAFFEPVQIKATNSRILQENCLRCHKDLLHDVVAGSSYGEDSVLCVHCHRGVGHGARR